MSKHVVHRPSRPECIVCPYMVDAVVSGPTRNVLRAHLGKIISKLGGSVPSHDGRNWLGDYSARTRITCAPNDGTRNCLKDEMTNLREKGVVFVANPVQTSRCLSDESIL